MPSFLPFMYWLVSLNLMKTKKRNNKLFQTPPPTKPRKRPQLKPSIKIEHEKVLLIKKQTIIYLIDTEKVINNLVKLNKSLKYM